MRRFEFAAAAALCLAAGFAHAAGFQLVTIPANTSRPAMRAAIWSPCREPFGEVNLGFTTLPATADCPIAGERLPLIIISYGYSGYFTGHHDTAETLADAGFVVVALDHLIDPRSGNVSGADTLISFLEWPADIKRLIDYMLGTWRDHSKLASDKIGVFGFSRGGYTGLVVAGGNPDPRKAITFCQDGSFKPVCVDLRRGESPALAPIHDPRVKAAVIADPSLGPLFDRQGLKDVKIPLQLWASEFSRAETTDGEVTPQFVAAIARDLPVAPETHMAPHAGHFAFLAPCLPGRIPGLAKICVDQPGFDRAAFHAQFNAAVLAFFRKTLTGGGR